MTVSITIRNEGCSVSLSGSGWLTLRTPHECRRCKASASRAQSIAGLTDDPRERALVADLWGRLLLARATALKAYDAE